MIIVKKDGSISVKAVNKQPHFGSTYDRVMTENTFMQIANERGLPAPFSLGEGEYPDLNFEGRTLGYNIIALRDLETDKRRLGNIFQVYPSSPEDYLYKLANIFFPHNATLNDLEYLFYAAGRVQRQYNDKGLIPNDCHIGNFALTEEGQAVLNDFSDGKNKVDLSIPQIAFYQLLDINRFIYSTFVLRGWPVGDFLVSNTDIYPVSAYLDGYFGQDVLKDIGTPEEMIRGLKRPRKEPDENRFKGLMEIMNYSWNYLYEPLQEVLAAEGNAYPLKPQERIERFMAIFKSFFGNKKPNSPK